MGAVDDVGGIFGRPQQPVIDSQMDWPHRRRHGHPNGALYSGRQPLGLDDRPVGLGERRADGRRAGVVGNVQADEVGKAAGVAGECDDHDRQAAGPDVDQLPHGLGQTGAQMHYHDGRAQVRLGVSAGHRRHRAFVKAEDAVYIGPRVQLVEEQGFPRT